MMKSLLLDTCALLWLAIWLDLAERKFALTVLPLTRKTMIDAAKLPLHHRDPADRFIIATALENDLPVLTADGNFDKYGVKTIS